MKQLTGIDASFLYLESTRTPMHIGALNIYDQSTAPGGLVTFKSILKMIEDRLHLARSFRERVVNVPLALDHPYWINDPDFDLEYHVRHIALPAPGDWRQLCIQVARLHSRALDLDRPLWEFTVIEGLDNVPDIPKGSFALVSKVHHCAVDGMSGVEMSSAIHDLVPDAVPEPPKKPWRPEAEPTPAELLTRAGWNNIRQPLRFPQIVADTVPAIRKLRDPELDLPTKPGDVPRTRFNGKVSPHRVFESRTFELEQIKEIKNAVPGATINDVVLTICGGALRRYLDAHGELPDKSLVAMAPVSVRSDSQKKSAGNQVSTMSVALRTDITDPAARLAAVHETSSQAKELTNAVGAHLMTDYAQFVPAVTLAAATKLYARFADRVTPVFNCVVTNVPGPQVPLFSMGSKMVRNMGFGPIVDGLGLFMPILSYDGMLSISATSCREMMPDPAFFADCIQDTFDELYASTTSIDLTDPNDVASKAALKKVGKRAVAKKKAAPKKAASKKAVAKKAASKKAASKKAAPQKKAVAKKPAPTKAAKKRTSNRTTAKKV